MGAPRFLDRTPANDWEWLFVMQHYGLPVLVAEENGIVVGWAALSKWSDRCAYRDTAESSFYVREGFRARGIGRKLKEAIVEAGRTAGLHTIIARVAEGNEASLHLNEALGFKHIGVMREVGLKFGRRLDVHLTQLVYPDGPSDQR